MIQELMVVLCLPRGLLSLTVSSVNTSYTESQTRVKGGVKGLSSGDDSPARVNCLIEYSRKQRLTLALESFQMCLP